MRAVRSSTAEGVAMDHPIARLWLSGVMVVCGIVACPLVGCSDPLLESTAQDELDHEHGDGSSETLQDVGDAEASQATDAGQGNDVYARQRKAMVTRQLAARDIRNKRVLRAMQRVPRHKFVPATLMDRAYQDSPLPIGNRQTISQPYIVALMTQLVDPQPTDKALDIGTGSGYQAAVLAETVGRVYRPSKSSNPWQPRRRSDLNRSATRMSTPGRGTVIEVGPKRLRLTSSLLLLLPIISLSP